MIRRNGKIVIFSRFVLVNCNKVKYYNVPNLLDNRQFVCYNKV